MSKILAFGLFHFKTICTFAGGTLKLGGYYLSKISQTQTNTEWFLLMQYLGLKLHTHV